MTIEERAAEIAEAVGPTAHGYGAVRLAARKHLQALADEKNAEVIRLRQQIEAAFERIGQQSELPSKRAEESRQSSAEDSDPWPEDPGRTEKAEETTAAEGKEYRAQLLLCGDCGQIQIVVEKGRDWSRGVICPKCQGDRLTVMGLAYSVRSQNEVIQRIKDIAGQTFREFGRRIYEERMGEQRNNRPEQPSGPAH